MTTVNDNCQQLFHDAEQQLVAFLPSWLFGYIFNTLRANASIYTA